MQRLYQPPNFLIMDATQKKELLHLRIEQANEQMLDALAEMAEVLFKNWQPEVVSQTEAAAVPSWAKPLTAEESLADLREGLAEYEAGEYVTLEEAAKEAASW
jgi:predicted transcriptional regulator